MAPIEEYSRLLFPELSRWHWLNLSEEERERYFPTLSRLLRGDGEGESPERVGGGPSADSPAGEGSS